MELNVKQSGIERRTFMTQFRKTKGGKVHKRVDELYLRNDIPCGYELCKKCSYGYSKALQHFENATYCKGINFQHFLLLDGITIMKFVDVLSEPIFKNIIIPQSAWNYVKKMNPSIYKRMNILYNENADRFFVFLNEFAAETFVNQGLSQVPELYQERCTLLLANYLLSHWSPLDVQPIIICSTDTAKEKCSNNFPNAMTLLEYAKGIEHSSKIAERIEDLCRDKGGGRVLYDAYWTQDQLLDGLAKGTVKKGKFQMSQENYLEAFVSFAYGVQWFVQGKRSMNRSIQGDIVVAQLLPKSEWSCPEKTIRLRDTEEVTDTVKDEDDEEEEEEMDGLSEMTVKKKPRCDVIPTARIVGILRRNWRNYCGVILPPNIEGERRLLFSPAERLIPRIRIETSHYADLRGNKILVQIDSWPQDSHYPKGHYIRVIGEEGERATEDEVIMLEHEIPHGPFSDAIKACLPSMLWKPEPSDYRVDLTHLDVCSVDPEGCTDIDDALHCIELVDGRFEVGVHIADVTHFVRPGTAIDAEAAERSTTVYLCGRRIDMLPDLLSSNLCSLREDEPRYAFSVIWQLDEEANIESVKFVKSLIRSRAAFTYQRAQQIVDGDEIHNLAQSLRNLLKLSICLKSRRKVKGALELASSEIRFDVDRETGTPLKVIEKQHLPTMSMIEEFMLLANISVAERILEVFPDCAILRRHPIPNRESFKMLTDVASAIGFQLNVDTGKELAKSLDEVDRRCKEASLDANDARGMTARMLRMLTTRCMTQAVYFASATVPPEQYLHYGLATKVYTHFTSPIRRYADIMVHRLLATVIDVDKLHPSMVDHRRLIRQTENMNKRHHQAQYASRASVLLNTFLMIKEHPEPNIAAIVIGIRNNGIQVMVPKYGLESVIFFGSTNSSRNSNADVNRAKPTKKALSEADIRLCMERIALFQKITVSLTLEERNQRRRIRVRLLDPYVEGLSDGDENTSVVTGCEPGM